MAKYCSLLRLYVLVLFLTLCVECRAKSAESEESDEKVPEVSHFRIGESASLMFADEFKQTLERYLFGVCPQNFRVLGEKKNGTVTPAACNLDTDHQELAARLATLSLRAHSASRGDCLRFGTALANTLGELARTAANRAAATSASSEAVKKRKLSKSQKAKIQAKQRTALAVKKKAAAVAAAAAAKMASGTAV